MKTRTKSFLLLAVLSAAFAGSLSAAATLDPAKVYALGAIERHGITAVLPGSSAVRVTAHLGQPDEKLTSDTWVYRRYHGNAALQDADKCTMLVISFSQGRVATLQRANDAGVKLIAAQLNLPSTARQRVAQNK